MKLKWEGSYFHILSKILVDYKVALVSPDCSSPLGLEARFEDRQFRSYTFKAGCNPFMGRLNNVGGWCSGTNDNNHEFLEVDLRNVQHISRIATQGVPGSSLNSDSYVKTFLVAYSYDGTKWFTYEDSGGSVQVSTIICLNLFLVQCRSKGNISGGAHAHRRREPLGGYGGILPQKMLKSRGLEMLFPAFSKSYL